MVAVGRNSTGYTRREIKSRGMRWARYAARMGEMKILYVTLVRKPEGKRSHRAPRRRQKDNFTVHLREIGWKLWTGFIWLRVQISRGLL
jgi:hypothetical protein